MILYIFTKLAVNKYFSWFQFYHSYRTFFFYFLVLQCSFCYLPWLRGLFVASSRLLFIRYILAIFVVPTAKSTTISLLHIACHYNTKDVIPSRHFFFYLVYIYIFSCFVFSNTYFSSNCADLVLCLVFFYVYPVLYRFPRPMALLAIFLEYILIFDTNDWICK